MMPHKLIYIKMAVTQFSEAISALFSVALVISFPTILSVIASALAIIWWFIKFYEKYFKK